MTGAGESGKSTVLKQMRLIYAQGFSKSEKEEWRAIIFNNILSAFKVIIDAMEELGVEFDVKPNNVSHIILILWLSSKSLPSMVGLIAPLYLFINLAFYLLRGMLINLC